METADLMHFFSEYGLLVLYVWLLVGIFIVVVPEEVVMLTVGVLISRGIFSYFALVVACLGSLSGVTLSYFLGRFLARGLLVKYGKWLGVSEKRLVRAERVFKRHGKWSLPVGYFVPGTRHVMAVIAGTTQFSWKYFMLFTYPAGVVWVSLLVMLGYLAGDYWLQIFHLVAKYFYYVVVFFCALVVVCYLLYKFSRYRKN